MEATSNQAFKFVNQWPPIMCRWDPVGPVRNTQDEAIEDAVSYRLEEEAAGRKAAKTKIVMLPKLVP